MFGFSLHASPVIHIPILTKGIRGLDMQKLEENGSEIPDRVIEVLTQYPSEAIKKEYLKGVIRKYSPLQKLIDLGLTFPPVGEIHSEKYISSLVEGFHNCHAVFKKEPTEKEKIKQDDITRKNLAVYTGEMHGIMENIFNLLITYYVKEPENHQLIALMAWYKEKNTQSSSYDQKCFFELLDIFFIYGDGDYFFDTIPKELLEPIQELITLQYITNGYLYSLGEKDLSKIRVSELKTFKTCIELVLTKLKEMKECQNFSEQVIGRILFGGKPISPRIKKKYENSELFSQLTDQCLILEKDGSKREHSISGNMVFFMHQLIYSGWDFLMNIKECQSILIYLLGLSGELSEEKKSKILRFAQSGICKVVSQESLLLICVSDIEDHVYLSEMSVNEVIAFGDIVLEKNDRGLYSPICSLVFLKNWKKEEVFSLLKLGKEAVIDISQGKRHKEDIIGIQALIVNCEKDLKLLFPEHPGYDPLAIFIEHIPQYDMTLNVVQLGLRSLYRQYNITTITQCHRVFLDAGSCLEDLFIYAQSIYRLSSGDMQLYKSMLEVFISLDTYTKTQFLKYLGDIPNELSYDIIIHHAQDFGVFLTTNSLWGEDIRLSYELFQEENTQENHSEENTLWPDFFLKEAGFFNEVGFSEDIQREIVKTFLRMNQSLQDSFMFFFLGIEDTQRKFLKENSNYFSDKLRILRSVLYIFSSLDFNTFHTPEKIFEFIFGNNNISDVSIAVLQRKVEELENIIGYNELFSMVMRFLKHLDESVFEIIEEEVQITQDIENKTKRKAKKRNNTPLSANFDFLDNRSKELYSKIESTYNVGDVKYFVHDILSSDIIYDINVYLHIIFRYEYFSEEQKDVLVKKIKSSKGNIRAKEYSECIRVLPSFIDTPGLLGILIEKLSFFIKQQNANAHSKNIARLIFSFQYVGHDANDNICGALQNINFSTYNFSAQDIYMTLYGLLGFINLQEVSHISDTLFSQIYKLELDDEVDAICIRRIYALYKQDISKFLEESYQKAVLIKQGESSSFAERYLYEEIVKIFPEAIQGHFIDGYELDIYIPSISKNGLNIEFDGEGYHGPQKAQRNKVRDIFLGERHGIHICRVSAKEGELENTTKKIIESLKKIKQKKI